MGDDKFEQLVLIHELVEIFLLQKRGLSLKATDDFDIQFEKDREAGLHNEADEPGDDSHCPYRDEHRRAENIERLLCDMLGVNWHSYDKEVQAA